MCEKNNTHSGLKFDYENIDGLFHEDPIQRSIIMGKLTKKKLDKLFKKLDKKFRKDMQNLVKAAAKEKIGDAEVDSIVLDDVSIEITSENTESMASSSKSKSKASKSSASARCIYYCYVRGGTRICIRICV